VRRNQAALMSSSSSRCQTFHRPSSSCTGNSQTSE
jgi:hypothetical protein